MSHKPHWHVAPYFIVDDVVATANWYRDQLGFEYERFWNDPPSFCMVRRNGLTIMLAQLERTGAVRPNHTVDPEGGAWDAYVWVEDVDALHAEFRASAVGNAHFVPAGIVAVNRAQERGYSLVQMS